MNEEGMLPRLHEKFSALGPGLKGFLGPFSLSPLLREPSVLVQTHMTMQ